LKTLAAGVIGVVRRSAHARDHVMVLQELHVLARGVLDAPMTEPPLRRLSHVDH
jgi:hypothetical protein